MGSLSWYQIIITVIVAILVYAGIKAAASGMNASDVFCTSCGHLGATKTRTKGNLGIEIVLWLCLIVPGLVYSIWRMSSRTQVCASCGAATLVPADSPVAS